jgi:hypothetical protein
MWWGCRFVISSDGRSGHAISPSSQSRRCACLGLQFCRLLQTTEQIVGCAVICLPGVAETAGYELKTTAALMEGYGQRSAG